MGIRRQSREAAVQALFMCDFMNTWDEDSLVSCFEHFGVEADVREYAELVALGVLERRDEIDARITSASEHWSISRMGRVDRTILRVASFELLFARDIPTNVSINEAIEVAKRFGSDDSPTFVNGVLDRIAAVSRNKVRPLPKKALPEEEEVLEKVASA